MSSADTPDAHPAGLNYFNYFTEVEEHFQHVRGTSLFLLSPLDWALIESWKNAGVPLEAVLRGVDAAFEKWRAKKNQTKRVNSLAYCAQAVTEEADRIARGAPIVAKPAPEAPFSAEELRNHLITAATQVRQQGFEDAARTLEQLASEAELRLQNLEELESRLTALEEHLISHARASLSPEQGYEHRKELENYLRPYRSKFTADQLSRLERQFLDRKIFDLYSLPRLSLFYLR